MDSARSVDQAFESRLKTCVDDAASTTTVAAYAVNEAMIGMWADALMDDNPVYVDAEAARATGRAGVIAPPAMIQAWVMPKLSRMAQGARDVPGYAPYLEAVADAARATPHIAANVYRVLSEKGFTNSLATNCRQVYHRELRPGDHVRCVTTVETVTSEKRTAMGVGHFVTTRMDYLDQAANPVATQHWTVLRFRTPNEAERAEAAARRPETASRPADAAAPAASSGGTLSGPPEPGQTTARRLIPITPSLVIATTLATHDFYAIHHDVDWARSIGRPGIFTNILTTTGLVGGVMTRWGGPAVRLRSIDLRLFAPNYPGDVLSLAGRVSAVDGDEITMGVTGLNGLGTHVEAVVVATVPGR